MVLVTCDLAGNSLAMQLGEEFEDHLKSIIFLRLELQYCLF